MNITSRKYFYLLVTLFLLSFLPLYFINYKPIIGYTISYILTSLIFIPLCFYILQNEITGRDFIILFSFAVILRIILVPVHPTGSDDYYRYLWDGKVEASGINPYSYAPDASALSGLHSDILPKLVNYPDMKTIYPPVSQAIFYVSYLIGGESYFGLKIFHLIFDLITIFGIFLIIKRLNLPQKNILIYVLAPLPLFQFFIDAHVDSFGLTFIVFSIYFYLVNKKLLSFIFIGLSICVKPLGLILLPIYFLNEKFITGKIKSVLIPISICILLYIPFVFTGTPFQALLKFTENWTFNGVVFDILDSFIHDNQRVRLICAALLFITYLPVIFSKKSILNKIYFSLILLFIFSPIVHPWYLSWLVIMLPFIPKQSGIVYSGLISLTAFTVLNYRLAGTWHEYTLVLVFEYAPVIILFLMDLFSDRYAAQA